ncbi:periplasmic or secreted lipoprotein [Anopheles sinensis]|uniref:Periplasmic or secreted lipoprotein n=1 Tax=Anopheles sinensis TaxID=74873 RepID=A0A084VAG5_ANOSI|nr:periplasmic or secreted lipoprotein [Anopheles sinensis]
MAHRPLTLAKVHGERPAARQRTMEAPACVSVSNVGRNRRFVHGRHAGLGKGRRISIPMRSGNDISPRAGGSRWIRVEVRH